MRNCGLWCEKLLDVTDNDDRSWQELLRASWGIAGFHRWFRGSHVRDGQISLKGSFKTLSKTNSALVTTSAIGYKAEITRVRNGVRNTNWATAVGKVEPIVKNYAFCRPVLDGVFQEIWEWNLNSVPSRILVFLMPSEVRVSLHSSVVWIRTVLFNQIPYCLHLLSFSSSHRKASGKHKLNSLQLTPNWKKLIERELGSFHGFFLLAFTPLCPKVPCKLCKSFQVPF